MMQRRYNDRKIAALSVAELQADEIRTIIGDKKHPVWVFTTIDIWSRLRGLFETEHVLRRTAESHDPTRLSGSVANSGL
jgi:hypothetical protein